MTGDGMAETLLDTTELAPAKINLRLEILGLRPDGYHEVATLLHPLDLADQVRVVVSRATGGPGLASNRQPVNLVCPGHPALGGSANLAYRAAEAWLAARQAAGSGLPAGLTVNISIAKRIPVAAGLGGGSADAAAVLRALQRLQPLPEPLPTVLAQDLGADVPFCLANRPAVGLGRGDELHPAAGVLSGEVLLAVPPFGVAARDAYSWWDEQGSLRTLERPSAVLAGLVAGHPLTLELVLQPGFTRNDLQAAVVGRHPLVGLLADALAARGAASAGMTGSGSAVYALFPAGGGEAARMAQALGERFPGVAWLSCGFGPACTRPAGDAPR